MYAESPIAQNSIRRWVQYFEKLGRVGNTEVSGISGASSNREEKSLFILFDMQEGLHQ